MGFYSIYKILKDMLRTLFGKHFLKILIIAILIFSIFFIYNECFATNSFLINGVTFNVDFSSSSYNPNANYITILRCNSGTNNYFYICLKTELPVHIQKTNTYIRLFSYINSNSRTAYYYDYKTVNKTTSTINFSTPNGNDNQTFYTNNTTFDPNSLQVLYSDTNVYLNDEEVYNPYIPPSLSNTQTQLENLNFNNFIINANSYTEELENNNATLFMLFYNRSLTNSQTTDGLYPIKEKGFAKGSIYTDYDNSSSDNMVFSYPIFNSGVFFNIGSTYEIRFAKQVYNSEYNTNVYEYLGEPIQFTVSTNVTQDYINQLNQQTATSTDEDNSQEQLNAINNQTQAIENQTQSIDNINSSITNSTVDNSSINLPSDNTNDPTQSGVDNIFQTIYNSFTSGTPQDIVFPIPFSNNNLTIKPNYVSNMLGSTQRRKLNYFIYSSLLLVSN